MCDFEVLQTVFAFAFLLKKEAAVDCVFPFEGCLLIGEFKLVVSCQRHTFERLLVWFAKNKNKEPKVL